MTLSIPDGLIRALRENRLPSKVEVWHAERGEWVSLAGHPAARQALESIGSYMPALAASVEPELVPSAEEPGTSIEATPEVAPMLEVGPASEPPSPEPQEVLLAAAHEFIPPPADATVSPKPEAPEASKAETPQPKPEPDVLANIELLPEARRTEIPPSRPSRLDIMPPPRQHERRVREAPSVVERRHSAAATPPAEPPAPKPGFKLTFTLPSRRVLIGGGVAVLIAVGYFFRERSGDAKPGAADKTVAATPTPVSQPPTVLPPPPESVAAEAMPRFAVDSGDTAPQVNALQLQGLPGGGPESDLEDRLRLADALMWDPARDFGSPAGILRARRKVDAVLNSVQAYRVDVRRLAESGGASRLGNRMEPFDEASRIDDVIGAMGDAISVLEDVTGRFAVQGGVLEFDRTDDARRYNRLRERADSLLRAPVPMDLHPSVRPPRRLVSRLLSTLPGGMARGP